MATTDNLSPLKATTAPSSSNAFKAALWMLGALLSFASMAVAGRELSTEMGTFSILFFRSLIGLIIMLAVCARHGWHHARTPQFGAHLLRNLAHYGGQFGWFFGIALLPLAQVFAIEFTIPIWTLLMAMLFLGEKLNRWRMLAVTFGIAGMLVILRPGMADLNIAMLAVLGGALGYAVSYVMTKRIIARDSALTVLFYMTVIQLPIGFFAALPGWVTPSPAMWPWLFVVGATALSAHFCVTHALALADAMIVIPMDFLRLPLIAFVGAIFYAEPLDPLLFVGTAMMVMGNMLNLRKANLS